MIYMQILILLVIKVLENGICVTSFYKSPFWEEQKKANIELSNKGYMIILQPVICIIFRRE